MLVPRCGRSSTSKINTEKLGVQSDAAPTSDWPGLLIRPAPGSIIWQTFSPAGCGWRSESSAKRKNRAPPDARFDTMDSDRSVFFRKHDCHDAGRLLRIAWVFAAVLHCAVVVIDFPKEPFAADFEVAGVMLASWIVIVREG